MENYQPAEDGPSQNLGDNGTEERDNRKRVAAGTIAGNPARKKWRGMCSGFFIKLF